MTGSAATPTSRKRGAGAPDEPPATAGNPATNDPATNDPAAEDPTTAAVATYELARDELAAVVHKLESGGLSLDESLTLWERGEHLAAVCSRFLDNARERVESALARAEQADQQ